MADTPRPVMLAILDGWGWREDDADNAVRQAHTPTFDRLWATGPHAFLRTSGHDVGLPDGQMGNSEVGHLNIGAGRVVMQDLPRIDRAVADGSIDRLPAVQSMIAKLKSTRGTLHLMGLLSPGGVHSHQDHAVALARVFAEAHIPVVLHAWTDGRDTPPESAPGFLDRFDHALPRVGSISMGTLCGRYYAMDRDKRWDRVEKAYRAMVEGIGQHASGAMAAVIDAHKRGITDEFIEPTVIDGYAGMKDGDALLCWNFRADRVRQILGAMLDPGFGGFRRTRMIRFCAAAGMTEYSKELSERMDVLFPQQSMQDILGEVVSRAGLKQIRMAETEKYPHVTYFLNGGEETPYPGEDRVMVPSPKVATYDLQPEMSAPELTEKAVEAIGSGKYDLVVLNFANADMVGHSGNLAAAIKACEAVDTGLGKIVEAIGKAGGALLVTADHGNAELMKDPVTGGPHTAHTTNPVPVLLFGGPQGAALADGRLADLAPTLLALMHLKQPEAMTGESLLRR
ncbi:2,3-bisphosphoglycerate-independent phosphoglycerate mutase [Roseomonas sp. NAR14]|uniref:2,3-bisphosphoglycerate-independent phosphoglycerate mutase n=1 Tax=Roseomonas acroporae TaxID=2937791 RepID=A0A9X1YHZ4_9PROT|nr:2,3-bisphosphoglycerate-independent phosphoglycerate mutase [Roseomonas acroporae]MCK8786511.1 2,3-bisphosphoglycerate-independent phosphoglycerate mutase [Roseomonas acroporae]